jgi:hypothetical protein
MKAIGNVLVWSTVFFMVSVTAYFPLFLMCMYLARRTGLDNDWLLLLWFGLAPLASMVVGAWAARRLMGGLDNENPAPVVMQDSGSKLLGNP